MVEVVSHTLVALVVYQDKEIMEDIVKEGQPQSHTTEVEAVAVKVALEAQARYVLAMKEALVQLLVMQTTIVELVVVAVVEDHMVVASTLLARDKLVGVMAVIIQLEVLLLLILEVVVVEVVNLLLVVMVVLVLLCLDTNIKDKCNGSLG